MYRQIGYRVGIFLSVGTSLPYVFIQATNYLMLYPGKELMIGVCAGLICALVVPFRALPPLQNESTQQSKSNFLLGLLLGLFFGAFNILIVCMGAILCMGALVFSALGDLATGIIFGIIWGACVFTALPSEILDKQETTQGEPL